MTGGTNSFDMLSLDGADVLPGMDSSVLWWKSTVNWTINESADADEDNPWIWDAEMELPNLKWAATSAALAGTATISNMEPRIGDVLDGSLEGSNSTGKLTYVWKADGTEVGTEESYTVDEADLGQEITLEIGSSAESGTITRDATAAVSKKVAPSAPVAPTLVSNTHNTVTLMANTAYEFSKDGTSWQTSNVFGGLTASTACIFYQRVAETSDTEASAAS